MCLLHACSSVHGRGWLGLVHKPLVKEFASFESRRTGPKEQGCFPGSEAVISKCFATTPRILNFPLDKKAGAGERGARGGATKRTF